MTRNEAISAANEIKGGACARPYSFNPDGSIENWGVTDCHNLVIPYRDTPAWHTYQLRFMQH